MELTEFKARLDRIDEKLSLRKLQELERVFTELNSSLFYNLEIILGADDDKPGIRGTQIVEYGIPRNPGKTTHTFSAVHEVNSIGFNVPIARASQSHGTTSTSCTNKMLCQIQSIHSLNSIDSLLVIDRGYTEMLKVRQICTFSCFIFRFFQHHNYTFINYYTFIFATLTF
jgi:hypothetical protein